MRKADECWSKLLQHMSEAQWDKQDEVIFQLEDLVGVVPDVSEKSVERTLEAMVKNGFVGRTEYGGYVPLRTLTDTPEDPLLNESEEYRKNRMRMYFSEHSNCPTCGSSRDIVGYSLVD